MSIFEAVMLICFGAAWPFSIYRSYKSGKTAGKSIAFLCIVNIGYLAGLAHKILYSLDLVTYLYALNFTMVSLDIALYLRNRSREKTTAAPQTPQPPR